METNQPKTSSYSLKYGLMMAGIGIILGLMLYFMEMHYSQDWKISALSVVISIVIISMALIHFRKANDGFLSLGQALKIGVGAALISGIVSVIYQMIFMNVIEPDFMDNMMEIRKAEMIAQNPEMTQEQIAQATEMMKSFSGPGFVVAFTLIASLFFGFIISLISGLILKRARPE